MSPQIVPATPELLERFYGDAPRRTMHALAAVLDEQPLCIAGTFMDGDRKVVFADMRDRMRSFPKVGMRMARRVMGAVRESGAPVFAIADAEVDAAPRFLIHLGFQPIREGVYAWLA